MNDILQLKGQFKHAKASQAGPISLPKNAKVTSDDIRKLISSLSDAYRYWQDQQETSPVQPLVSIHYDRVVAKSNRAQRILACNGDLNDAIKGAKFGGTKEDPFHIIIYLVTLKAMRESIEILEECEKLLEQYFSGFMDDEKLQKITTADLKLKGCNLSKSAFAQIIRDACFIKSFEVEKMDENADDYMIVSLYDTNGKEPISFMKDLGFDIERNHVLDNAILLSRKDYNALIGKYPYLVSMSVRNLSEQPEIDIKAQKPSKVAIEEPGNQPIIGVIDTPFDNNVYFSHWVESDNELPEGIEPNQSDYEHGTAISSIIVDGPALNPELDDGCGHFRVRHFGAATGGEFNSFEFMRSVDKIVRENRDIKVWNISMGSDLPVSNNFISPEAALLDKLQSEFDDIVFVVAGTNKTPKYETDIIGAPADSINSLVVNATDFNGETASYSRQGPVLEFFKKPDICYVGGDNNKQMHLCVSSGETWTKGTSFAAPWIARKMAFLMQVMGFSREVAKALLIDAAAGWQFIDDAKRGYGFVPTKISDILQTPNDEIRFIVTGTTNEYETYNYDIPVPTSKNTHPFIARATMCYFPSCERNQGVDYTASEMDLHFGRIDDKNKIVSLKKNPQGEKGIYLYEKQARNFYRKWDNVKHINDVPKSNSRARKVYSTEMWGIKVLLVERDNKNLRRGRGMPFGIVITLKEIDGVNRIDDFIQKCSLRGWIVNRINIKNQVDIYNAAQVDINFDD